MTPLVMQTMIGFFLIVCRVGVALASMPLFAGPRVPMFVRILAVLAVSMAITPVVLADHAATRFADDGELIFGVIVEVFTGFVIGFWSYCFTHAVRFGATYVSNAIGLSGIPGQPMLDTESDSTIGTILSLGFVALVLATNLHLISIKALIESYDVVPLGGALNTQWSMSKGIEVLGRTSLVSLQILSPFMLLSVTVNFGLGVANRLTPQLSVFFAFTGLLTFLAIFALAVVSPTMLLIVNDAYRDFLENLFK